MASCALEPNRQKYASWGVNCALVGKETHWARKRWHQFHPVDFVGGGEKGNTLFWKSCHRFRLDWKLNQGELNGCSQKIHFSPKYHFSHPLYFVLPHIPGTPNSFWRVFGDFRCKNNLY